MADEVAVIFKDTVMVKKITETFSINALRPSQIKALKELFSGHDVFVIQPTGSGKSLIFQSFPLIKDLINGKTQTSMAIVISPLTSLMKDQVNFLNSVGIKAAFIGEEQTDECVKQGVEQGKYQLVYGSPESFLLNRRWRDMLSNEVYRKNLCLVAIDEAHCISHWGFAPKKGEKIFRKWFGRINEVRSLISSNIPLLALTATATTETRKRICSSLEMNNAVLIKDNPNRLNVTYSVQVVGNDPLSTFDALIKEINEKAILCHRTIIYCKTIRVATRIYGHLQAELGTRMYKNSSKDPKERLVEMFHSRIDELNKDHILDSFSKENGGIRVLVATIAYGMGIDCKDVKTIIHYGPSRNTESYLQESGRAGRNTNASCNAVILYNNVMLQNCDDAMVSYVRNSKVCRRKLLLSHFDVRDCDITHKGSLHNCCDICRSMCHCNGDNCNSEFNIPISPLPNIPHVTSPQAKQRSVSSEQKELLKLKLDYLKKSITSYYLKKAISTSVLPMTNIDLITGFGDSQILQVVEHCEKLFTIEDIYKFVDIWKPNYGYDVLFIIQDIFQDTECNEIPEIEISEECITPDFWQLDDDDVAMLNVPLEYFQISEDIDQEITESDDELL